MSSSRPNAPRQVPPPPNSRAGTSYTRFIPREELQGFANWTYLVPAWSLEPLLKERAQLMAEKKEEPKKDANPSAGAEGKPEEPQVENPPLPLPEMKP